MISRFSFPRALLAAAALVACAAALPRPAAAQPDSVAAVAADSLYEVRLADGSVIFGRIVEQSVEELTIETQGGATVRVRRAQIAVIRPLRGRVVSGQVWAEDPHATRLFFGPTARSVPQGEGYLGVYELFFPFVTYGVTDRLTISGGTPIIPEIIGEVFYIAPKLEVIRTPTVSAAVGALAFFAGELDGSVGLVYAVGTMGSPDRALTVGATVPFVTSDDTGDIRDTPTFMIGGEARIARQAKLLTENYFFPGSDGGMLLSGGVRFFGERLSADFGVGLATDATETACCLPLVNFVYSF